MKTKVKTNDHAFQPRRLPLALVLTFGRRRVASGRMLLKKELIGGVAGTEAGGRCGRVMAFDFGRVRLIEDFQAGQELIADRLANIREEFHRRASVPSPTGGRASIGMRPGSALNPAVYEAASLLNQRH